MMIRHLVMKKWRLRNPRYASEFERSDKKAIEYENYAKI